MVETDVELILGQIRDRVRATHEASAVASNDVDSSALARNSTRAASAAETLALINSYLTTTARAWDQLPPLVSNRKGVSARIELWLKRFFRSGTRWYVWEQVNFNAAIHHALRDLLPVISLYQNALETLHAETMARQQIQSELAARRSEHAAWFAQTEADLQALSEVSAQVQLQLKGLTAELRERDEHLRDEQRVCFKQVTLEMSEAATLEDRGRRKTETLLAELQRRIDEIEKK
jgi:hypothetical protein